MEKEGFGLLGVIGCVVIAVSYFMYPDAYHQFFQWLQDGFFDAVNSSFDGNGISGEGKNGGNKK